MFELPVIYTIGHSTRTLSEFSELLQAEHIEWLADIRTVPLSRTNPQFNFNTLPQALAVQNIDYIQLAKLGGLRKKSKTVAPDINGFWINQSFHNYADYALSEEFEQGLLRLQELSQGQRCAIMCSEAVWWRCHRRIVADYLLYRGRMVVHLMGRGRAAPATLTAAATPLGNSLLYPAPVVG
ncbi:DUF488 family protein [Pseudomonas fluorescens]|uniref:DNA repair protein n=1 Tax=Pseudomonas fluorescens TaxID=294 RepID=A0A5E7AMA1_PSEFL|nr:DUF488 domain-containing protein [Pseudomonas fluorescens]VVN80428.1 hypothetical protein PS704_01060 [Pseudomonas fluorescens]